MIFKSISKKTLAISLVLAPVIAYPHSGGLDKNGCHRNSKTGDYHCHNGSATPAPSPAPSPSPTLPSMISGKVISVTDGDTLTIQDAKDSYSIRLAEIDAPEKCQAFGPESRSGLVDLALNRLANVEVVEKDKYGRIVGKVLVEGQFENVNKTLLRKGLAWVYDDYANDFSLNALEDAARNSRIGLWSAQSPMPPWEWRRGGYGCSRDPETGTSQESPIASAVEKQTVFEFFNSANNHYFMTASALEANAIDQGYAGPDWKRTGNTFKAWPLESSEVNTLEVCRFYNPTANSHFFTANTFECSVLQGFESEHKKLNGEASPFSGWRYEGMAFKIKVPANDGTCPLGTDAIHRAYNNRHDQKDQNHRFSPWKEDIAKLEESGWVGEGVAMCAIK